METPRPLEGHPDHLVTLSDAAAALGVSVRTVRRFIEYGYVEAYRVGPRVIRLTVGDVNALIHRMPRVESRDDGPEATEDG